MRRKKKKIVFAIVAVGLILCGLGVFGVFRCSNLIDELKNFNDALNSRLSVYESNLQNVCRINTPIDAGTVISSQMVDYVQVPAEAVPEDCITGVSQAVGRTARIGLFPGTYLTGSMLTEGTVSKDEREMTYSSVSVDWNISTHDVVDFRILYPDGTDYIIVSHKRIVSMPEDRSSVAVNMSEEEILFMDSAAVDAFTNGSAILYAIRYTEPELQEPATVNYTPSLQTIELIENDPNIVSIASGYLSGQLRLKLEGGTP